MKFLFVSFVAQVCSPAMSLRVTRIVESTHLLWFSMVPVMDCTRFSAVASRCGVVDSSFDFYGCLL